MIAAISPWEGNMKRKIFLLICSVLIAALLIGVLAACDPGSKEQGGTQTPGDTTTPGEPGITTPVNPGQDDEEQQPEQGDEGQEPGQDDEEQDPEQGDEGQGEGDEEIPEMSEAEYYEQNIELLKTAIVEEYKKDFDYDASVEVNSEHDFIINKASGEIYFFGDRSDMFGGSKNLFFVAKFDKNILNDTQKNVNAILTSTASSFDISFEFHKSIRGNLSTEVYAEFSNYLLKQNYAFGEESVSFGEGAEILDISQYIVDYSAYGGRHIQFPVIDGDKIYMARLENAMPSSMYDAGIKAIMGYGNNVFKITAVKDFKEFGVDEG